MRLKLAVHRSGPRFLFLFLVLLAGCGLRGGSRPPNIIVILVDTLRADHLGCYGYARPTSPFLDSLAARAVFFESCSAVAPRTEPSVASLFTSLYPSRHGAVNSLTVRDQKQVLPERVVTLAEMFRANGYGTAAVLTNGNASARFGYAQGFETSPMLHDARAAAVGTRALAELGKLGAERPFFLYLHYMDPHSPYLPPVPYQNHFDPEYRGTILGTSHEQIFRILAGEETATARDIEHLIAQYDGEILYLDQALRTLFSALRAEGYLENTLILFTADHGEEFWDHGKLFHGYTLYQEQLHVPLFVWGEGLRVQGRQPSPAGSRSRSPCSTCCRPWPACPARPTRRSGRGAISPR